MKRIKSPQDLDNLRNKAKAEIDLREGLKDIRITIHMGTCGIAAGARDVLSTIMQELAAARIDSVSLQQAGCVGLCDQEPMITITNKAGEIFRYGRLDRNRTHAIIHSHILRGAVVSEYLIRD
jgi:NADP-reducing hydrogenase subunit HndB